MTIKESLVSIGLPVFNGERYLRQALDSLLAQDYEHFELIISDNGSTDATPQICREYTARDKRISYYRSEVNLGAAWNFNQVFQLASGAYFMWAAHDDYWDSRYLRSCLEAFSTSGSVILAGTMCDLINAETGNLIYTDEGFSTVGLKPAERFRRYKSTIHAGRHIGGIFYGVYKSNALRKVMPMRRVVANDHLILAQLCFEGEFVTVPERLIVKRWGGASTSHRDNARALGITNPFFVRFPYLVREVLLQKIIFRTEKLTRLHKVGLAGWSSGNYLILVLRLRCRALLNRALGSAIRARELWRNRKGSGE